MNTLVQAGGLVVVASPEVAARLETLLAGRGWQRAADVEQALAALARGGVGQVLLELGPEGLEAVERLRAAAPQATLVALAPAGREAQALEALARGADTATALAGLDAVRLAGLLDRRAPTGLSFRAIVERVADLVVLLTHDGLCRYMSPSVRQLLGYEPEHFLGRGDMLLVAEEDRERAASAFREVRGRPGAVVHYEFRVQARDGSWRWLDGVATNLLDDPSVGHILAAYRDATARKQAEASFRALIEGLPTAVMVRRGERLLFANPALLRLLGYATQAELAAVPALAEVHPEDQPRVRARIEQVRAEGRTPPAELRFVRRDGSGVVAETEALLLPFDGQPAIVVFARDLTERRELQARMAAADRLASVGMLAAGVAHEVNNPLAYVLSNLSVLAEAVPALLAGEPARSGLKPGDVPGLLREAQEGAARVAAVVRDLRSLSQADHSPRAPVDVRAALVAAVKMARNEIRHRARLVEEWGAAPPVEASEGRLVQVFLNLLVNAAQAIPEGQSEGHEIRVRTGTDPAGRALVEIADTGPGIPAEHLPRIFDPFFTTKKGGAGTGLGLAICQSIVRAYQGELSVRSQVGQGTVVQVALPACPVAPPAPAAPAPAPAEGQPLRILVVDDEVYFGTTLGWLLAPHQVVPLTEARVALERLAAGERYDAILCDLMMPGMDGIEFYAELARLHPESALKVIFLTGGVYSPRARSFLSQIPNRCLEKPVTEAQLWEALRELLEQGPG